MYSGLVANTLVGWRTTNGLDCETKERLAVRNVMSSLAKGKEVGNLGVEDLF